jgi:hypothetical protein
MLKKKPYKDKSIKITTDFSTETLKDSVYHIKFLFHLQL